MVEILNAHEPVDYDVAIETMGARVQAIQNSEAPELLWFLEHPPLYTAGTSAKNTDLLSPERFPVYPTGRGGEFTYHGPGQRVVYVMLDLKKLFAPDPPDLRRYIQMLEQWIIATLKTFDIDSDVREGRVGVWVNQPDGKEAKIAALGVRVTKWISYHGIAINLNPDLEHFSGIVPCGIREHGVTSLTDMGVDTTMEALDTMLVRQFDEVFDLAK